MVVLVMTGLMVMAILKQKENRVHCESQVRETIAPVLARSAMLVTIVCSIR